MENIFLSKSTFCWGQHLDHSETHCQESRAQQVAQSCEVRDGEVVWIQSSSPEPEHHQPCYVEQNQHLQGNTWMCLYFTQVSPIGETYEKFIIFIPLLSIHYLVELFELEGNEDYFYFIFILCLFKHNTVSSFNNSPSILRKTLRCFYCGSFDHQRLNYFKFNLYCPHWMFAQISWLAAMC